VKIGRCEVAGKVAWFTTQKNSCSTGLVPAPILPKMGRSHPKLPERCHPLTCPRVPNLVWIGCVLPHLFQKDDFFAQKLGTISSFQPDIVLRIKYFKRSMLSAYNYVV